MPMCGRVCSVQCAYPYTIAPGCTNTYSSFSKLCAPGGMVNDEIHFHEGFWLILSITGAVVRTIELDGEEVAGKE